MKLLPSPVKSKTREENPEARMTFTEHLGELRSRMLFCVYAIAVGFVVCYVFRNQVIGLIAKPLSGFQTTLPGETGQAANGARGVNWTVLTPLEPILVVLKLSMYGGLLLAFPVILYHICAFVFPGLTAAERRAVRILLYGCSILAVSGVGVAYFFIFPLVLPYLVQWAPDFVVIQLRLNDTLSLIIKGLFGFAIAFQFPMVVLVLVYMDLLTPATLKQYRRFAIVLIFVVSMLLTPPDPFSMLMMGVPLCLLYEVSILASHLVVRRKRAVEPAAPAGSGA